MAAAVVIVGVVAAVFAWLYLRQRHELRRLTRAIRGCDSRLNGRLAVGVRLAEVVDLAAAVNDLLDAERQARGEELAARRAFEHDLAALAHDVRTPLAGAQGYLELAEADPNPAAWERYQEAARERLGVARGLVEDLFEYTRLAVATEEDATGREAEPVEVLAVVEEALAAQYPAFLERGWRPHIDFEDEHVQVRAPREDLARVCANLTVNVLRHGAAAPVIVQRGRSVTFSNAVENPGAVEVSRLFERFYRADAARGGEGSGLGLAIVKCLCDRMGVGISARLKDGVLAIELRMPE